MTTDDLRAWLHRRATHLVLQQVGATWTAEASVTVPGMTRRPRPRAFGNDERSALASLKAQVEGYRGEAPAEWLPDDLG